MFKMFLKDYNFCHYCHAKEEQLMVCEPCGLVKYCNEKCQYNDAYRHDELCLKIKKYLADWLFYQSLSQEYRDEHEHEGLKALTQVYPDAKFVFSYRSLVEVVPSLASHNWKV